MPPPSQTPHSIVSVVSQDVESPTTSRRSSASSTSATSLDQRNDAVTTDLGWQYATIHKLDSLGYRDTPTPNVAVCGEQSVGKSNLLSWLFDGKICFYSGTGTATWGPTQVLSHRNKSTKFKAEVFVDFHSPAPGRPKRARFTQQPLTSGDGMAEILRLAGDEARRSEDGYLPIRTLEELKNLSEADRRCEVGRRFTKNVVLLLLEGYEVPDLAIIDLPDLAMAYLSRPQTFIMLCLAAGGYRMGIAAEIVERCDPDGKRSIGLITKADKIDAPEEDFWGKMIANDVPGVFRPALGYWPLRLALPTERNGKASQQQLEARLRTMFEEDGWRDLASRCGRRFGWQPVREAIFTRFLTIAKANQPLLIRHIGEKLAVHEAALAELPGELEDPEEQLHGIIAGIERKFLIEYSKKVYAGKLLDIFMKCQKDLCSSVPELRPIDKADEDEENVIFRPVQLDDRDRCWGDHALDRPKLYVDELVEMMGDFENPLFMPRIDYTMVHPLELGLVENYLSDWTKTLRSAIPQIGMVLADLAHEVVTTACPEMERAREIFLTALEEEQQRLTSRLASMVQVWCDREKNMPLEVELSPANKPARIDQYCQAGMRFYDAQYPSNADDDPPQRENHRKKIADGWRAIRIAAYVTTHLWDASLRVSDLFRREGQCLIKDFFNGVGRTLRTAMRCANDATRKRARELCEPDDETCRLRDGHKEKRARLLAIRDEMRG